jgi:hypothetical protein
MFRDGACVFHVAGFEDIKQGKLADAYFVRTLEILKRKGTDTRVRETREAQETRETRKTSIGRL